MAIDISEGELGKGLRNLALESCDKLQKMVYEELIVRQKGKNTNLQNYMLNESMVLVQYVESVLSVYKQMMTQSYNRTAKFHGIDTEKLK